MRITVRIDILLDNVNVEVDEPAPSASETPKSEHILMKRRSVHQDTEKRIVAANFPVNIEESKNSAGSPSHTGSASGNVQKKEHREATAAFLCRNVRNSQDSVVSKLNAGASTSSGTADHPDLESVNYTHPTHFDYNHFDIAANENVDVDDKRTDRWKRPRRDDGRYNSLDLYETANGYMNPIFFNADELENLNAVPVYTTKDGKITYSPNPRFTYHELLMEARAKETCSNTHDPYFARSPSLDYYNCSKLRKVFKRCREVAAALRKRDINPVNTKQQFTTKHIDYLLSKNAHHAKARSTLEFFNDDADKLYANRSPDQQESKEDSAKSSADVNLPEKQCNPDCEPASNAKHSRSKTPVENLDFERDYKSPTFDPNIFLEPKPLCWEETMESVKSYSSHVDRRNSNNLKELNFSEIFAKQKQLDNSPFPFLHTEQESLSDNDDHKASNNDEKANELPTLSHTTCSYSNDNLHLVRDDDSHCEQSSTVARNEQDDINDSQNSVLPKIEVNNGQQINKSPSIEHDAPLHDQHAKKQQSHFDEVQTAAIVFAKEASPCIPVDDEVRVSNIDQCSTSHVQETFTESLAADDSLVPLSEDKLSAEDVTVKEVSDKNSTEITSSSRSNADRDDLPGEPKCTEETAKELPALGADEQVDEINSDSAKNNSDSIANDEVAYQETLKPAPADREGEEEKSGEVSTVTESGVTAEIYFSDVTSERDDLRDKENSTVCEEEEVIISQNPPDVVAAASLDEESNEQKSQKLQDNEQSAESSSKDPGIDVVDCCSSTVLFEQTTTLDLDSMKPEENMCNIVASEMYEQNISEFTVIKSIIKADKEHCEELKTREIIKDNDSIIDSKLLCMDSSDCGIYPEDRCTLMQISEHDFTEEDSMVPMEWETSRIQEDAVNRLCGIDESLIDFVDAANSLRSEDNLLLDNLSLSRSMMKEPRLLELPPEDDSKLDEPELLGEPTASLSPPMLEKFMTPSCDDENAEQKDQNPVSSSSYDKVKYLHSTDCNANTKIVPKLVIKKTEANSKFVTKMSPSSFVEDVANKSAWKPSCQPKIPKMIIRNAKSRPSTPSIESVLDEAFVQASVSERIATHETREDSYENDSESSLQGPGGYKYKIPKMKIKLDEKHANKVVTAEDTEELCVKRKNTKKTIPKVKIKNSPRSDQPYNSTYNNATLQESRNLERHEEKIPVLKLKKQERNRSSSPELIRKRQSSSHSDLSTKRYRKSRYDDTVEHSTQRSSNDSARTNAMECETKSKPMIRVSEKVPKVIIKRASASAEFKCELSKNDRNVIAKSAKWQPEVKLERYRVLDSMAKDLKSCSSLSPVSLRIIDKIFASRKSNCQRSKHNAHRLSRSNSTSELFPVKCKQRRMSDYDCRKTCCMSRDELSSASSRDDSKNTRTCSTPKRSASTRDHGKSTGDCHKNDKSRRSRSRDNNSRTESDVVPSDKKTIERDQSAVRKSSSGKVTSQRGECKIDVCDVKQEKVEEDTSSSIKLDQKNPPKHPGSMNFKTALKELKATSKMEDRLVKSPGLSEMPFEETKMQKNEEQSKEDDPFLCTDDDKIVIQEQLNSDDMDIECAMQDDVVSLREEPFLSNFEMNNDAVIKIESSDESQTTIEILPASPDNSNNELENHISDDGDSEQLYSADAIPTQFELELEIADNSNVDLLDMPMLKLNPCYSSRHAEEDYSNATSKAGCYGKDEPPHRDKNPLRKDKHLSNGNRRASESVKSISCVDKISPTFPCSTGRDSQSKPNEKFCCNDSLIKEVLAAKETLKKCLSKSRCESSAKPRTAMEKKQGSSFDLNSLSETHSKSSDSPESCRGNVTLRTGSTPAASKHNKTESIANAEKSDKKHSKPSKSVFTKKKVKAPDKRCDEELRPALTSTDSKETTKDIHECITISLKTFKRSGQVASSHKDVARVINLSEKRKKNPGDQRDVVPQSPRKEESKLSSYKIPKISKSAEQESNGSSGNAKESTENNMPILEPVMVVDFNPGSDRDSSRSPPVITDQDVADVDVTAVSKLLDNDKVITSDNKDESDMKDIHKKNEMSIADFVSQLAYHDKVRLSLQHVFPTDSSISFLAYLSSLTRIIAGDNKAQTVL